MQAVAEHAAEEVLLGGDRVDQGGGDAEHVAQVHVGCRLLLEPRPRVAGADRYHVQVLAAGGPRQATGRDRGHEDRDRGGIVERGDGAVDKEVRLVAQPDLLGREVARRRGAAAQELPQRDLQVAARQRGIVEGGARVVGHRPWRARRCVAHDDEQQLPQAGRPKKRGLSAAGRLGELAEEEPGDGLGAVLRLPPIVPTLPGE